MPPGVRAKVLTAVLLAGALSGCRHGATVKEHAAFLEKSFQIRKPAGSGPFPAVLLFHGCGGLVGEESEKRIMPDYARAAVEAGFAVIIVDSLRPRGIGFDQARKTVCKGLRLRGRNRAGDVVAAVYYAKGLSFVAPEKIVLAGWSHGGWAVMETMIMDLETDWPPSLQKPAPGALDGVVAVYLTYPYCGFPSRAPQRRWARRARTSVVLAELDEVAKRKPCERAFVRMQESGVSLDVEIYASQTHAFDEADQTEHSEFIYDSAATERAHARFKGFLLNLRQH